MRDDLARPDKVCPVRLFSFFFARRERHRHAEPHDGFVASSVPHGEHDVENVNGDMTERATSAYPFCLASLDVRVRVPLRFRAPFFGGCSSL